MVNCCSFPESGLLDVLFFSLHGNIFYNDTSKYFGGFSGKRRKEGGKKIRKGKEERKIEKLVFSDALKIQSLLL